MLEQIKITVGFIAIVCCTLGVSVRAQTTNNQTNVPVEALQHSFEDYMSFSYSHGGLCQMTLRKLAPGVQGIPQGAEITMNMAGIITSSWKQDVAKPDGTAPVLWSFECVSEIQAGKRVKMLSLSMYQERGAERRGIELLTGRDIHIVHEPK